MYQITDVTAAIKNVQKLLGVNQTGLYDNNTKEAVLNVQLLNQIEPTGKVDYKTFSAIYEDQVRKKNSEPPAPLARHIFPFVYGDYDDNIDLINMLIKKVLSDYTYEGIYPRGSYFGDETLLAVRALRSIFLMEGSDELDYDLFERIWQENHAINLKNNVGIKSMD